MSGSWSSIQTLIAQGLKVAWFGVLVTCFGLLFPHMRWLSFLGLAATAVGLVLRHRAEHLKLLQSAPRTLRPEAVGLMIEALRRVPKQPLSVGFLGQDPEAEQYAIQIKETFQAAGFRLVGLEGFVVFKSQFGLTLTVFNSDSSNPTASGIREALTGAGLQLEVDVNPNKHDPGICLNVYAKPPSRAGEK